MRASPTRRARVLALVFAAAALPVWAQSTSAVRIRGTVARLDQDRLLVQSREGGEVAVTLSAGMRISGVVPAKLGDIKPGDFVGSAAMPMPDGRLRALEIHIFPESLRGTNEGHNPFDLLPDSTMTNATVAESVAANDGQTLILKYKGGEKVLVVSPETPIVSYVPADRADLAPGAGVVVRATRSGETMTAGSISVGKGIMPPM